MNPPHHKNPSKFDSTNGSVRGSLKGSLTGSLRGPLRGSLSDDPRLSAWVLGELDEEEQALVEAALSEDDSARAQADELRSLAGELREALVEDCPAHSLSLTQRQEILASARAADKGLGTPTPARHRSVTHQPVAAWLGLGSAAAAAIIGLLVLINWPANEAQVDGSTAAELIPSSGGYQTLVELVPVRMVNDDGSQGPILMASSLRSSGVDQGWQTPRDLDEPKSVLPGGLKSAAKSRDWMWAEARPAGWPSTHRDGVVLSASPGQLGEWLPRIGEVAVAERRVRIEDGPCPWSAGERLMQIQVWLPEGTPGGDLAIALDSQEASELRLLQCLGEAREGGALWTALCSYRPAEMGRAARAVALHGVDERRDQTDLWSWELNSSNPHGVLEQCSGAFLVQAALAGWQLRETGELLPGQFDNSRLASLLDEGIGDAAARARLESLMRL